MIPLLDKAFDIFSEAARLIPVVGDLVAKVIDFFKELVSQVIEWAQQASQNSQLPQDAQQTFNSAYEQGARDELEQPGGGVPSQTPTPMVGGTTSAPPSTPTPVAPTQAPAPTPMTPANGPIDAPAPSNFDQGTVQGRIDQAMAFFQSKGWSREQAAGIVANLQAESGVDPGRAQDGGGPGYGIAQWEGPRQASFAQWAGHDIHGSTLEEQLEFVQWELGNTESAAGNALRGVTDPAEAARIVTRLYERPADIEGDAAHRAGLAQQIYANS